MKLEFDYWKIQKPCDGGFETTYEKTGVWQTKPFNAVAITEAEYLSKTNYLIDIIDTEGVENILNK